MGINRAADLRSDFPFLTRRVKPAAASAQAQPTQPTAPAELSLDLSAANDDSQRGNSAAGLRSGAASSANPAARLFSAPRIDEVRALDERTPLVRLTPLQSAIGSLLVSGTRAVVWEATNLTTGARTAEGMPADVIGTSVKTAGNRELLDYLETVAVLPLRHIRQLRRALFIPQPGSSMMIELFDGGSVAVPFGATDPVGSPRPQMHVLSLLRVGNEVELRAEPLPRGLNPQDIWTEFGFTMTESVSARLRST